MNDRLYFGADISGVAAVAIVRNSASNPADGFWYTIKLSNAHGHSTDINVFPARDDNDHYTLLQWDINVNHSE